MTVCLRPTFCDLCIDQTGSEPEDGVCSGWPCRDRKDREHQGSGECARQVLLCVQLLSGNGLPGPRKYFQRYIVCNTNPFVVQHDQYHSLGDNDWSIVMAQIRFLVVSVQQTTCYKRRISTVRVFFSADGAAAAPCWGVCPSLPPRVTLAFSGGSHLA